MKKKISIYHIVCAVILLIMVIICIYPIVWMFFGSMKDKAEFYTNIWGLPNSCLEECGSWQTFYQ